MKKLILVLALAVPAAGCAATRAYVPPEEHPALEVPPVPPRYLDPVPVEQPPMPEVAEIPTGEAPAAPPRPRPNSREPSSRPADPKSAETKPVEPDPAAPAPPPVPLLRQGTGDASELERQVRETLDLAGKMLSGVNPDTLNDERRANLEHAKSFIKQAESELKAKNLSAAKSLADRAEKIARLLTGGDETTTSQP